MNGALGRFVRRSRGEAGLTLQAAALRLGVDKAVLSRWERGHLHVPESMLEPLAGAVGVPLEDLRVRWVPSGHGLHPTIKQAGCRDRAYLPPYPTQATLKAMLTDPRAREAYQQALAAEPSVAVQEEIRDAFPRDSCFELHATYKAIGEGARLVYCCLLHLDFRKSVVQKETERYVGDMYRHALLARHAEGILLLVPQVSLLVLSQSRERRADFLVLFTRGRQKLWADLEMDGGLSDRNVNDDARRAYGLGLYRISRTRERLVSRHFLSDLVRDCTRHLEEVSSRRPGLRKAA